MPQVGTARTPGTGWSSGRRAGKKLTAASEGMGLDSACPPGFRTQLHVNRWQL